MRRKLANGSTHWSSRTLVGQLGLPPARRICAIAQIELVELARWDPIEFFL
uniref:hypothetical protein n=1 Tax=Paraburkholderia podalyriae TaxID=1938811 RepID=UPI001654F9FB